jgi:hypothetical protein
VASDGRYQLRAVVVGQQAEVAAEHDLLNDPSVHGSRSSMAARACSNPGGHAASADSEAARAQLLSMFGQRDPPVGVPADQAGDRAGR